MQERHTDRRLYFEDLARTSQKYFIPYIERLHPVRPGTRVLEIGCGDGGNLLPLALRGCQTTGVDMAPGRIDDARAFFAEAGATGEFVAADIFGLKGLDGRFDIILCHDVLEHIAQKAQLLTAIARWLAPRGIAFVAFPAWPMPFGGHQQICSSKTLSRLPFVHLLPTPLYRRLLVAGGEKEKCVRELLDIKRTGVWTAPFERLTRQAGLAIADRRLWLVNPHYETKFGLKPRRLPPLAASVPGLRDFLSTSCFYLLRQA